MLRGANNPSSETAAQTTIVRPFECYTLIKAAQEKDGQWYAYAPVALTNGEDHDRQILSKAGVDRGLVMHDRFGGHVDYMHKFAGTKDLQYLIGRRVATVDIDGQTNIVTRFLKSKPLAKACWEHLQDGGVLGYSLQGLAKAFDPANKRHVTDMDIYLITIDPMPKGYEATRLRTGLPDGVAPGGLGDVMKSFSGELGRGDLHGWYAQDDFDVAKAIGAITTGDGAFTSGDMGGKALRKEAIGSHAASEGRLVHDRKRCRVCGTVNHSSRLSCRECGLNFPGSSRAGHHK